MGQVTQGRCLPVLVSARAGICDTTRRRCALALPTEAHFVCQKPVGHQFGPGSLCPVPLPVTLSGLVVFSGAHVNTKKQAGSMCWSAAGSSICVCVCVCVFSLLGPSRRLQPWTGSRKDTDPGCSCRCGVPRGEKRGKWRSRQAPGHPSTDVALCCFRGGSGPGAGQAVPVQPLRVHLAGWTHTRRAGAQHRVPCRSPAVVRPLPSEACTSPLAWTSHSDALHPALAPPRSQRALLPQPREHCGCRAALLPVQFSTYLGL